MKDKFLQLPYPHRGWAIAAQSQFGDVVAARKQLEEQIRQLEVAGNFDEAKRLAVGLVIEETYTEL